MTSQVRRMTICVFILVCYLHIRDVNTTGVCLYLSEKRASWFDALKQCIRNDMCLGEINTEVALGQLILKSAAPLQQYWFGLNAYEKNTFSYVTNDEPADFVPQDSRLVNNGSCGYLKPHEGTYQFDSADCNLYKKFICARAEMCNNVNLKAKTECVISEEHRSIVAF